MTRWHYRSRWGREKEQFSYCSHGESVQRRRKRKKYRGMISRSRTNLSPQVKKIRWISMKRRTLRNMSR